jgi:hypothetical protein
VSPLDWPCDINPRYIGQEWWTIFITNPTDGDKQFLQYRGEEKWTFGIEFMITATEIVGDGDEEILIGFVVFRHARTLNAVQGLFPLFHVDWAGRTYEEEIEWVKKGGAYNEY